MVIILDLTGFLAELFAVLANLFVVDWFQLSFDPGIQAKDIAEASRIDKLPMSNVFKSSFLMGVLGLLLMLNLIISIQGRRLPYFYYSIYLVLAILFFFNHYHFLFNELFVVNFYGWQLWYLLEQVLFPLGFAFYLLYLKAEVRTITSFGGFLNEIWSAYIGLLFFAAVGASFFFFVWGDVELGLQFKSAYRSIGFLVAPLLCLLIFRIPNPLVRFVSSGAVILFVGANISMAFQMIFLDSYWLTAMDVMLMSVIIELIIFISFMGFRLRRNEDQISDQQESLISELKKKELQAALLISELKKKELQGELLREQLHLELEERTAQIELESEKTLQAEYKERMAELEMKALRSQMNPHFLFNSLNSLKRLVLEQDHENAQIYIDKFSVLLRNILNNSREAEIDLKSEIETIRLYLELENLRFKKKFDFIIIHDPDIDLHEVEVPPMLLQPFVENAIWHGLMHKPNGQRKLEIFIKKHSKNIEISIRDNGVGRSLGTALKKKRDKFRSLGGQITAERLQLINSFEDERKVSARVVDLYDPSERPTGTEVILKLAQ